MQNQAAKTLKTMQLSVIEKLLFIPGIRPQIYVNGSLATILGLIILPLPIFATQQASSQTVDRVSIRGSVFDSSGKPIAAAVVRLEKATSPDDVETKTDAAGAYMFSALRGGVYRLSAEKSGLHSLSTKVVASAQEAQKKIDLVLEAPSSAHSPVQPMEFSDAPHFTVAGVTDWTAVGGHGSDSTLQTSEALASEARTLKPEKPSDGSTSATGDANGNAASEAKLQAALALAPGSFTANHQLGELYLRTGKFQESIPRLHAAYSIDPANHDNEYDLALAYEKNGDASKARERLTALMAQEDNANLHRLAGEIDEKLGDPLNAVREYEQAAHMDPSEQNYFEWGSELLLHRAVWQAQEVFHRGAAAYPKSARMQTALGTALFAGARYDEAAATLCAASDLNPADPEPYIFMGRFQAAAPDPLACVEQKLARFARQQPDNSLANYFYAMAILKRQERSEDKQATQQAESLLAKAVTIDDKCAEAYLQLGILYSSRHDVERAISYYQKAIKADSKLGDAHYRLGVAYDRIGRSDDAKLEFKRHDEIERQQAEAVEQQRREVKQFLVVLPKQPASPDAH